VSAVAVIVTRPVFCAPALSQCRELSFNQLTGTLPAAWSALPGLREMWVPCALADPRVPPRCGCSLLGLCGRHLVQLCRQLPVCQTRGQHQGHPAGCMRLPQNSSLHCLACTSLQQDPAAHIIIIIIVTQDYTAD
jgi:hypothetical protein